MFGYSPRPGRFKMSATPPARVKAGTWYFGFDCLDCSQRFAILDDPSAGRSPLRFAGNGHYKVKCPHCGAAARSYRAEAIKTFQQS